MTKKIPASVIDTSDSRWHWDRKVPIALILTLIVTFAGQSVTALWWASKIDSRVDQLEKENIAAAPNNDRLTRVEVKLESVQAGISELKDILRNPLPQRVR